MDINMTDNYVGLRYFSDMNPWVDVVIIVDKCYEDRAAKAIIKAMDEYWGDDCYDGYGSMIERELNEEKIPFIGVWHDDEEEDLFSEYESRWEDLIRPINCKYLR